MPFKKGNRFGRKFEPGHIPWLCGRHHSDESKNKLSVAHTGKILTKEHCAKLSASLKGRIFSEEHRLKLCISRRKRTDCGRKCVDKIKKECPVCLFRFEVLPSRDDKRFCSRRCAIVGRKKSTHDRSGEKNPKWKGGITPLRQAIWKSDRYDTWRRNIFTRDRRTCSECGTNKGELQVHHTPYEFADILKDFNIKTLEDALACDILWDEDNGKVLCVRCHRRTYKFNGNQYGK